MTPKCPVCDCPLSNQRWHVSGYEKGSHYYSEVSSSFTYFRYSPPSFEDNVTMTFYSDGDVLLEHKNHFSILLDASSIDFDPKHPEPIFEKLRLLETYQ